MPSFETMARLARRLLRYRAAWLILGIVGLLFFWLVLDPLLWWLGRAWDLVVFGVGTGLGTRLGRHVVFHIALFALLWIRRHRWLAAWRELRIGQRLHRHRRALEDLAKGSTPRVRASRAPSTRSSVTVTEPAPAWLPTQEALVAYRTSRSRGERLPLPVMTADAPALLRRSIVQLSVEGQPDGVGDPSAYEQRLRRAVAEFPDDLALLRLSSDLLVASGREDEAFEAASRLLSVAPPADRVAIRSRCVDLGARLVRRDLAAPNRGIAAARERLAALLAIAPGDEELVLLDAELAIASDDRAGALAKWIGLWSERSLGRALDLLESESGETSIEDLLRLLPFEVALAVLARAAAIHGQTALAERAARVLLRRVGPTPAAIALHSACSDRPTSTLLSSGPPGR